MILSKSYLHYYNMKYQMMTSMNGAGHHQTNRLNESLRVPLAHISFASLGFCIVLHLYNPPECSDSIFDVGVKELFFFEGGDGTSVKDTLAGA
mmetsp:Transcript_35780/g.47226  ORF Transcript_35780/g.47226 Transcript_35780/m.47226 type:complete len:93 (-) Transcript_35780:816-1094(-)